MLFRSDPGHRLHGVLAHVGLDRGEPEPAVADGDRGDAVPARQRAVRVPEDLGVVVGVQIDEAGGDVHAPGVDDLGGLAGVDPADGGDDAEGEVLFFEDGALFDVDFGVGEEFAAGAEFIPKGLGQGGDGGAGFEVQSEAGEGGVG